MNKSDYKRISKRLRKSDPKQWDSMSPEERMTVVHKYEEIVAMENQPLEKVIDSSWALSDQISFMTLGVLFGLVGGLASDVFADTFANQEIWKKSLILIAFLLLLFGSYWLERAVISAGYKHGRLLSKLRSKQ